MKLTCPSCGAVCSAEGFLADATARQVLAAACELPGSVARVALSYLAMFRPQGGKRGMAWSKALRLILELQALVNGPFVQWKQKAARPNNAAAWARAMERMIEQPPKQLPLTSHGYLTAIAYEIADEMDRAREVRHNRDERSGSLPAQKTPGAPRRKEMDAPERLDTSWMKQMGSGKLQKSVAK